LYLALSYIEKYVKEQRVKTQKNLLNELAVLADSDRYPFHMPGHKRNLQSLWESVGDGMAAEAKAVLAQAARLDITEIDDFDNLHAPEGILKEALQRAAALYGADETFYSVNGSTAGLLTAISAAASENSRILMARNCHKAVYHALYLRRLTPVFLYPGVLGEISVADTLTPADVELALQENPDIKTVVLTSPTYDGICADVKMIAEVVHTHGAVLIVDAAHGAHFGFHPGFPESPVRQGADLTVVSLHKTLPAMTQTALLHVKGERVDIKRLRMFSGMYQTSSPSYFFMAGMDSCIRLLEKKGPALWDSFFVFRREFLEKTKSLEKLQLLTAVLPEKSRNSSRNVHAASDRLFGEKSMDAGKILIQTRKTDLTGQRLYDILLEKYHLQMEMAAGDYVTAIVTCCDSQEGWMRLAEALLEIDRSCQFAQRPQNMRRPYPVLKQAMRLQEALDGIQESCPLNEAEGRIAGTFVNLYPPGIPLAVPGERLSAEVIALIQAYAQEGLPLQGTECGCVTVIKEHRG